MDSGEHGNMFFTSLLTQEPELDHIYIGQGEQHPVTLDDSPPLPQVDPPPSQRKSARDANFTPEEDKLLVSAWLNSSIDAIQGTDQKHAQLWEKVSQYFNDYKESTNERSVGSLIHRWSAIQKATNKFCAKLAQVEGLNQSGMTEQDKFDKAKVMYQSLEKTTFQFEHCWQLLKDQPKWNQRCTKDGTKRRSTMSPTYSRTSSMATNSPIDSVGGTEGENMETNDVIDLDRPIGRKAEKGKRKAQGRASEELVELSKKRYTLLEESRAQEKEFFRLKAEKMAYEREMEENKTRQEDERLRLEAEKLEIARLEREERIMLLDVSTLNEVQQVYFQQLQREILARRTASSD
ncbi:hypothetical protein F2P56_010052 [Juglans regia]|uniref:No apical meristem-associated C-terminal domain-containing protein n=2 Tax=Juglans regia TaxID=51240 RepID=A0A833XPU1_JUGRE|nr:glutathione S-transferase T3-like [Juglans regia]KAF5473441.1 hypothetical protein F2P56_010052 [Juglans regia]